jgi:hypothetical protein
MVWYGLCDLYKYSLYVAGAIYVHLVTSRYGLFGPKGPLENTIMHWNNCRVMRLFKKMIGDLNHNLIIACLNEFSGLQNGWQMIYYIFA